MKKSLLPFIFLLISLLSQGQITATFTSQLNTNCAGQGCLYTGPAILINEIMMAPLNGDGSMWEPNCDASGRCAEWIELYNPDICKPVDISCYYLGNNANDVDENYPGGFTIPPGTIVPPRGFVIIRGPRAPAVPTNLLLQNGGRTIEIIVSGSNACIGFGDRLWFPNAGNWFAFYNAQGIPQDAISWGNRSNLNQYPCVASVSGCSFTGTLANYNEISAARKTTVGDVNAGNNPGLTYRRSPDGGAWQYNAPGNPTYGTCNSTCAAAPVITCTGSLTVSPTGGNSPYTYQWNESQLQSTQTATGLCAGSYCVIVRDNSGNRATFCGTVSDFVPTVDAGPDQTICSGTTTTISATGSPGLSYTWNNALGSGATKNITPLTTTTYTVTGTDANRCSNSDQVTVQVNPTPSGTIGTTTDVCHFAPNPNITFTGSNSSAPYAFTYSLNGGPEETIVTTSGNLVSFPVSTSNTGTFNYRLISTIAAAHPNCVNTSAGEAQIVVHPLPTAAISGGEIVCQNAPSPLIRFTGSNGTAPYTFTYTINGGTPLTVSTGMVSTVTINASTAVPGFFTYNLLSVSDAYNCSSLASGSVVVRIVPSPLATISGATTICENSTQPEILFTGSDGTPPYTFIYNINGGPDISISTASGNSVSVFAPTDVPGVFSYNLLTVFESGTFACSDQPNQSSVITVNPTPIVSDKISTICSGNQFSVTPVNNPPIEIVPSGITYSWPIPTAPDVLGGAAGTGTNVSQTLINLTNTIQMARYVVTPTAASCVGPDFLVDISVNPIPIIADKTIEICSGNTFVITPTNDQPNEIVPGGTTYSWSTPLVTGGMTGGFAQNNALSISGTLINPTNIPQTATYTITPVSGAAGNCAGLPFTVVVTVNPTPVIPNQNFTFCSEGAFTINPENIVNALVPAATTYIWNIPNVLPSNSVFGATAQLTGVIEISQNLINTTRNQSNVIYAITPVSGAQGACSGQPFIISIRLLPSIILNALAVNASCNGICDGSVNVAANGGSGQYNYVWNNFYQGASVNGLCAGNYTVMVTDLSQVCNAQALVTINQPRPLILDVINKIDCSCKDACNGTATVSASGGTAPYNYNWALPTVQASGASANNLCAGSYNVSVRDFNNCLANSILKIEEPDSVAVFINASDTLLCVNQSAILTASSTGGSGSGYSYVWSTGQTANPITVTPNSLTTYSVTSTDILNNCISSPVFVRLYVRDSLTVKTNGRVDVCEGDSIEIFAAVYGGDGNYNYSWTPGGSTSGSFYYHVGDPQNFSVSVGDGCTTPMVTEQVIVDVLKTPIPEFVTNLTESCAPGCVVFTNLSERVEGIKQFTWKINNKEYNTEQPELTVCFEKAGVYDAELMVLAENGCRRAIKKEELIQIFPVPTADFYASPIETTINDPYVSFYNISTGADNFFWNFGDGTTKNLDFSDTYNFYTDSGTYCIQLIAMNNDLCSDTIERCLKVSSEVEVYIPNAFTPNENSLNEIFNLKGFAIVPEDFELQIFNRWGQIVFKTNDMYQGWDGRDSTGKMAQSEVYVYKFLVKDFVGKRREFVGKVSLIR
jgi:gliding motility-associated-like protein